MLKSKGFYKQRIKFKGREIFIKNNPRKGIYQQCGKTGYTHLHHEQYDDNDILKHTIELCPGCHAKESCRLGDFQRS
jgi:hypothetical protein